MRLQTITIVGLTLAGFSLRLHYLLSSHPFFDEYTSVLAARETLRHGWPILPSGLFYEHGLLATYLMAPFTALFINLPITEWQSAHWGLMLARWPSLLVGALTIPLIYAIGQRGLRGPARIGAALLAAGLFALSPEGIVWGGRARMYALATLLALLTVYLAYRGAQHPAPAKYRWWALLALLALLLTQFGAMLLLPSLLVAMLVVGWLSHRTANSRKAWRIAHNNDYVSDHTLHAPRSPLHASRPWFLRPAVLLEGAALTTLIGLAIWIKRLGQPLGVAALSSLEGDQLTTELLNTVTYQTAFFFSWPDAIEFLARQFGVPHHFWLAGLTAIGAVVGLVGWFMERNTDLEFRKKAGRNSNFYFSISSFFHLFLWLTFGLIILEMVSLLEPFRRNPRYLVMFLPLFYLIAGNAIFNLRRLLKFIPQLHPWASSLPALRSSLYPLSAVALLVVLTLLGLPDLKVALFTPEPAYEKAFAWLAANRQPDDTILTMNTPAAGLYLGRADGFTVQTRAEQFLLNADSRPVDRWLGSPWIGRAAEFNAALNNSPQSWFVIDAIRQPVYFRGDWLAVVNSQLEQVWASDNAIIYRTRPDRQPIPTEPDTIINANLNHTIQLVGYTSQTPSDHNQPPNQQTNQSLHLTLFWQPFISPPADYTTFVHLRDHGGATVAQYDGQPLAGIYPTSRWQPDEVVIDPINLALPANLPAGQYKLFAGLYQLDTLERLPVVNDSSGENAIFLGEVTLP